MRPVRSFPDLDLKEALRDRHLEHAVAVRALVELTAAIEVTFADFGITAPTAGPANVVDDHGTVELFLTLQRP